MSDKMNLLMISGDRAMLQGKKGAFWYTLEEMSSHFERIDVICPRVWGEGAERALRESEATFFGNVHFHVSPKGLWYQPWWILKKGRELAKERRYRVMTVHEYPPFYNGIGAKWLRKVTKIPSVTEVHHIVGYPRAAGPIEWVGRILSRLILPGLAKKSDAVRVVNKGAAATLQLWGVPASKVRVVSSLYLDGEVLRPDPSIKKVYDVAFCGRLVANKGLMNVIEAMGLLRRRMIVIGDGPERERADQRVIMAGMSDNITFVGWLPNQEDVYKAIQSARIFLMNSSSEGGPRVALEAMALGLPIVSTRVGVMPEVIEDGKNGLFVDGTPEDIVLKVASLLADEELCERMGKETQKVTERFERKALIGAYAEFLRGVGAHAVR